MDGTAFEEVVSLEDEVRTTKFSKDCAALLRREIGMNPGGIEEPLRELGGFKGGVAEPGREAEVAPESEFALPEISAWFEEPESLLRSML